MSDPQQQPQPIETTEGDEAMKMAAAAQEFTTALLRVLQLIPQITDEEQKAAMSTYYHAVAKRATDTLWPEMEGKGATIH